MRVLVAGATSVPGIPVVRELVARGHEVVGLTRAPGATATIAAGGARPVVVDVFDAAQLAEVLAEHRPEVVVSLLTTLPKRGPMRLSDFEPARRLWSDGVNNLLAAAHRSGVRRVVAESVIFAYGYGPDGPALLEESDPYPMPPPQGGEAMLTALRDMEQRVLDADGIVLRYGFFYGDDVPHMRTIRRIVRFWALPVPSGRSMLSFIHIDDVARTTVDAVERGRGGELYNIVDDRPESFGDFIRALAKRVRAPRPLTVPNRLFAVAAPYAALAMGNTWLPLSNAKAKAEFGWTPITRP